NATSPASPGRATHSQRPAFSRAVIVMLLPARASWPRRHEATTRGTRLPLAPRGTRGFGMTVVRWVAQGGEAGFGEGDGQAAVGNVMGGLDDALSGEGDEAVDEALFVGEVDRGRFAGNNGGDGLAVFRGGEFPGGISSGAWRVARGERGKRRAIEQDDKVAGVAEGDFQDAGDIVKDAEHADHGRRVDGFAEGFVVEADVAAGDGRAKGGAGVGDAVDRFAELPHHFRLLRAAEVEAVRGGNGARAACGYVARGFRDGVHRADAWS